MGLVWVDSAVLWKVKHLYKHQYSSWVRCYGISSHITNKTFSCNNFCRQYLSHWIVFRWSAVCFQQMMGRQLIHSKRLKWNWLIPLTHINYAILLEPFCFPAWLMKNLFLPDEMLFRLLIFSSCCPWLAGETVGGWGRGLNKYNTHLVTFLQYAAVHEQTPSRV